MANIQIIQGDFEKKLKLPIAEGLKAGFPSPAEDYSHETLDFNRDLIRNPEATFYGKVEGDSMIEAGINDGDIAVNQQKFSFEYVGMNNNRHQVRANKGFSMIGYTQMDLGIAKYHFEIGAGKDNFEWI